MYDLPETFDKSNIIVEGENENVVIASIQRSRINSENSSLSSWFIISSFDLTYLLTLYDLNFLFSQPIQRIDPLADLRIDLCNLSLEVADSIQIVITQRELMFLL